MDGRVVLQRKKFPKFYTKLPGWEKHIKQTHRFRNHSDVSSIKLKAIHFITQVY